LVREVAPVCWRSWGSKADFGPKLVGKGTSKFKEGLKEKVFGGFTQVGYKPGGDMGKGD